MSDGPSTSYDEVPYASMPHAESHPDRLAVVATLFGLQPADPASCRVLELGCASGGNLIPMALASPEAQFVGIDASALQIEAGRGLIGELGLTNIVLHARDLVGLPEDFGRFDYIICHGVFSWVPEAARAAILEICASRLAEHGVAYVSYNTYPGWHLRGMVREMMADHARQFDGPAAQIQQARAFLDFLARGTPAQESAYALVLKDEADRLRNRGDSYLYHEYLEEVNQPIHVRDFVAQAAAKELQYLEDASYDGSAGPFQPEIQDALALLAGDPIRREQYLDYLTNRRFRRSLLCRADRTPTRPPTPEALRALRVTGLAHPRPLSPEASEATPKDSEEFATATGATIQTNNPLVKAVLHELASAWPGSLSFDDLGGLARDRLAATPEVGQVAEDRLPGFLAEFLYQALASKLVEFHAHPDPFVREPGERPAASPLARLQTGAIPRVTNLRHVVVNLEPVDQVVLHHLDGTRDRAALVEILVDAVIGGRLDLRQGDEPIRDPDRIRPILTGAVDESLRRLASGALLIG